LLLGTAMIRVAGLAPGRLLGRGGGRALAAVGVLLAVMLGLALDVTGLSLATRLAVAAGTVLAFGVFAWRQVFDDQERRGLRSLIPWWSRSEARPSPGAFSPPP